MECDDEENDDNSNDDEPTICDDGLNCDGFCVQCQCDQLFITERRSIFTTAPDDATENKLKGIKLFSRWSCNRSTTVYNSVNI